MSGRSVSCTPDDFAVEINRMLAQVADGIDEGMEPVVRGACKVAVKKASRGAPELTGKYRRGFSYKLKGAAHEVSGEVGNRLKPGLVHLLEKGHATIGGGRVKAYPHVAPAAEDAFDELERGIDELVGRVL